MRLKLYAVQLLALLFFTTTQVFSQAPAVITETEPNGTSATAQLLNTSSQNTIIVSGIVTAGDQDWFRIDGVAAGAKFWGYVDPGGTQGAGATSRDTQLRIFAADGTTEIEFDDDDGTGNGGDATTETGLASAIGGRTLTAGGTYYIRINAFSATGVINPYRLFFTITASALPVAEAEANNTSATANTIATASQTFGVRTGAIGAAGDVDYYSVVAKAGHIIYVNADCDPERDGTGQDLLIDVLGTDGSTALITGGIDGSISGSLTNPAAEAASFTVLADGTYFIRVRHFSASGTGTYHLFTSAVQPTAAGGGPTPPVCTPEVEANNTFGTAQTLNISTQNVTMVCGTVTAGDQDWYRIDGVAAGAKFWGYVDPGGTQGAGATSRDSQIRIFAADGTTEIEFDDDDGTGNGGDATTETGLASAIGGRTLTAGGTYYIRVNAFSATGVINPYRLFFTVTAPSLPVAEAEANNTSATANSIVTAGQTFGVRTGSIGAAGDLDFYSVVARAGQIIYVNADCDPERDGTGQDLLIDVLGTDGSTALITGGIDGSISGSLTNPAAEAASFTVLADGTYFIRVRHFSASGTGTYHLFVASAQGAPAAACTITCPANITVPSSATACNATVTFPAPVTTGACGTVTVTPASGSVFPVGITTVTAQVSGGGPSCTFTVTVTDSRLPVITTQPANTSVCAGDNTTFTVVATNAVSYQWQVSNGGAFTDIGGATAATLTLNAVPASSNGNRYRVVVTGPCSSVTSNAATLTLFTLPTISVRADPVGKIYPGQQTGLLASFTGMPGTFSWYRNNTLTRTTIAPRINNLDIDSLGLWRVMLTDVNGCKASAEIRLEADPNFQFFVYPTPNTGQFQVRFYSYTLGVKRTLSVFDSKGARVFSREFTMNNPYERMDVDLTRYTSGTYYVELRDASGKVLGTAGTVTIK